MKLAAFLTLPCLIWNAGWASSSDLLRGSLIVFGAAFVIAGEMVRMAAIGEIYGKKTTTLVTSGVYSVVRNPLYLGNLIAGAGIAMIAGSVTMLLLFFLVYASIYSSVVRHEEVRLVREHASSFDAYASSVPRFVPKQIRLRFAWVRGMTREQLRYEMPNALGLTAAVLFVLIVTSVALGSGLPQFVP